MEEIRRKIADLDNRIEAARKRDTPGSIKAAGEMSRVRSGLLLELGLAKKNSNRGKLAIT